MLNRFPIAPLLALFLLLSPAFLLQARGGHIQYYDGLCWHDTGAPLHSLPANDRALLECGLPLEDADALTAALEDFCT